MPIGLAILGAGLFIKFEHLPAIQADNDFVVKAVYSRSLKSAKGVAETAKLADDNVYSDDSAQGLTELLARSDVEAVLVCLPIPKTAEIVQQCLKAGKHVLSEKPLAHTVAAAKETIEYHRQLASGGSKVLYGVAENFRFIEAFKRSHELISTELGGEVFNSSMVMHQLIDPESNVWFKTPWRTVPQFQGGFLLDGGVHFIAGLRAALGSDNAVTKLAAFSRLNKDYLLPVDTVNAVYQLKDGSSGWFSCSFGNTKDSFEVTIECSGGYVTATPDKVTWKKLGKDSAVVEEDFKGNKGKSAVARELQAFAESIKAGKLDPLLAPEEAYVDLAFIEQSLRSGESGAQALGISAV